MKEKHEEFLSLNDYLNWTHSKEEFTKRKVYRQKFVPDEKEQKLLDFGHRIHNRAKELFPDGYEETKELGFSEHIQRSCELLTRRIPLFELGIMFDNLYARPDILVPSENDGWDLIEVKSCIPVHDSHVRYTGFIRYVCASAGLRINRCFIYHLQGWIDDNTPLERIFNKTDVTERVLLMQDQIRGEIESMRGVVQKHKELKDVVSSEENTCPSTSLADYSIKSGDEIASCDENVRKYSLLSVLCGKISPGSDPAVQFLNRYIGYFSACSSGFREHIERWCRQYGKEMDFSNLCRCIFSCSLPAAGPEETILLRELRNVLTRIRENVLKHKNVPNPLDGLPDGIPEDFVRYPGCSMVEQCYICKPWTNRKHKEVFLSWILVFFLNRQKFPVLYDAFLGLLTKTYRLINLGRSPDFSSLSETSVVRTGKRKNLPDISISDVIGNNIRIVIENKLGPDDDQMRILRYCITSNEARYPVVYSLTAIPDCDPEKINLDFYGQEKPSLTDEIRKLSAKIRFVNVYRGRFGGHIFWNPPKNSGSSGFDILGAVRTAISEADSLSEERIYFEYAKVLIESLNDEFMTLDEYLETVGNIDCCLPGIVQKIQKDHGFPWTLHETLPIKVGPAFSIPLKEGHCTPFRMTLKGKIRISHQGVSALKTYFNERFGDRPRQAIKREICDCCGEKFRKSFGGSYEFDLKLLDDDGLYTNFRTYSGDLYEFCSNK